MLPACAYPEPRERRPMPPPVGPERYTRYETFSGAAGTGAVMAEIGRFSGVPDAITLEVTGGAVNVRLTDELGTEESQVLVSLGTVYETRISRRVVLAFNVSDAAPGNLRVLGKWLG